MRQLVQDLRSGAIDVIEVPDPTPRARHVVVRNAWSVISPGTEQSISRTAGRSLVGKALERPDQVRKVVDKATSARSRRTSSPCGAGGAPAGARWPEPIAVEHRPDPDAAKESAVLRPDSTKARVALGWAPARGLEPGLDATVEWFAAYARGEDPQGLTLRQIQAFSG